MYVYQIINIFYRKLRYKETETEIDTIAFIWRIRNGKNNAGTIVRSFT